MVLMATDQEQQYLTRHAGPAFVAGCPEFTQIMLAPNDKRCVETNAKQGSLETIVRRFSILYISTTNG